MAEDNGQGANLEPEQQSGGMLKDPQSRRRFLRAAAIGTAGVAGVAGAVGVAQATGAPKILKQVFGGATEGPSGQPPSADGFFQDTGMSTAGDCAAGNYYGGGSGQGPLNRYVTFYINDLPSGTYSFNVTQDIGAGPVPIAAQGSGSATQPWEFGGATAIHVVVKSASSTEPSCPTGPQDSLTGSPPSVYAFSTFASNTVTITTSSTNDVVIYVHIEIDKNKVGSGKAIPTLPSTTTFTLSGGATGTVNASLHP